MSSGCERSGTEGLEVETGSLFGHRRRKHDLGTMVGDCRSMFWCGSQQLLCILKPFRFGILQANLPYLGNNVLLCVQPRMMAYVGIKI